jgi:hypothetical protein
VLFSGNRAFRVDLLATLVRLKSCKTDTLTAFPSRICSLPVTAFTLSGSSKVKKAKPLERPSGSRIMVQASTLNARQYHNPSITSIGSLNSKINYLAKLGKISP